MKQRYIQFNKRLRFLANAASACAKSRSTFRIHFTLNAKCKISVDDRASLAYNAVTVSIITIELNRLIFQNTPYLEEFIWLVMPEGSVRSQYLLTPGMILFGCNRWLVPVP